MWQGWRVSVQACVDVLLKLVRSSVGHPKNLGPFPFTVPGNLDASAAPNTLYQYLKQITPPLSHLHVTPTTLPSPPDTHHAHQPPATSAHNPCRCAQYAIQQPHSDLGHAVGYSEAGEEHGICLLPLNQRRPVGGQQTHILCVSGEGEGKGEWDVNCKIIM